MGAELAEVYGRRNAVPGELLVRGLRSRRSSPTRTSPTEAADTHGRSIMIRCVSDRGKKGPWVEESLPSENLAARLREAVAQPLDAWREVYESFSPVDAETGERRPRVPPPGTVSRRAAVLVPVLLEPEGARLVYTLRRDHLQDHAGQISFPGGSMDPRDGSLLKTALREAEERLHALVTPGLVRDLLALVPDEWLTPEARFANPEAHRSAYAEYLLQRLAAPRDFVKEAADARAVSV